MHRAKPSPFVVPVGDLGRPHAAPRDVEVVASVDWHVELSAVEPSPSLRATLTLSPVAGGIMAKGTATYTLRHTCHRCLEQWTEEVSAPVAGLFADEALGDEDDYELAGDVIDLEAMLRDEVLLAMPLLPTCAGACTGLVPSQANDLNTPPPGDEGESRSPFAVLQDLFPPDD